jgi:GxxExxY protein
MNAEPHGANDLTSRIISCATRVSNTLGAGFLEKVYENALAVEFRTRSVSFEQQPGFLVRYRQEIVGEYIPDFVVSDSVIVEVKALDSLSTTHEAQCINYLRASGLHLALLFNFGRPRFELRRLVWKYQ